MTLQISNKPAVLKTLEHINQSLSSDQRWTKTGEAMTRQGQPTSPTANDAQSFSLTGAIKRGVQEIGSSENWTPAQIQPFEAEVESVFASVLAEQGYSMPANLTTAEAIRAAYPNMNPNHPQEAVLMQFNESAASFDTVRELIGSTQERVINYSD